MDAARRGGRGNLPTPAHSFVGRDRELATISILLDRARLITLTGPGGIGKTRLAAEALRRYRKAITGCARVHWVRLARLANDSDAVAVAEEVAHTVIEADFSGRSVWDALVDSLARTDTTGRTPHTTLVLDNCEHILAAAASVVTDLLEAIPEVTIVATSREPLGWIDEYLIPVPPLTRRHAVALFRRRAELTGHPITGTKEISIAAEICRHVHNNPLYIQLAAARLVHQAPAMILHGLTGHAGDTRLRWSHGPKVGADPRHRGVTDVIAWSYRLCTDTERLLFDRLSVFAAGYDTNPDDPTDTLVDVGADLDAIETICCDDDTDSDTNATTDDNSDNTWSGKDSDTAVTLARREIEGLLERLVERSLVSVHMTADTVRYSLVESLRVFARHQLCQRSTAGVDELARVADRHLLYYRDKIAYAVANWLDPEGPELLDWARATRTNTVTAIETSLASGQASIGLEMCLGLITLHVPFISGSVREMRRWTERCLDATRTVTPQPGELQIEAMAVLAWLALMQGLPEDAERMLEDCVTACVSDADAAATWRHTTEIDTGLPARVEYTWGLELLLVRRDARAVTVLTRARDKFDALGDHGTASYDETVAGLAASLLGPAQQAHQITQDFLDRANASRAPRAKSWAELARAVALTLHGDPAKALALERTALAYQLTTGDRWTGIWAVEFRTWSLAHLITDLLSTGNPDRDRLVALATEIAHLAGGTTTLCAELGVSIKAMGPFADESGKAVAVARRVLGLDAFTAAETRGSRLRPELSEVQRLALGTLTINIPPAEQAPSRWHELSPAEHQVATLAAAGWTNTAISARRGTSVRTIDSQVTAILHKLAITSREDIIDHIPRDVIDQVRTETTRQPHRASQKRNIETHVQPRP
ncbi:AAA family ATPase [Nocardia sp. NPDC049190]|uniref:ATP-binding protein n=1 Tax=Nocardia sp. NPDC049190 TaxID=3155650 RepID=UPI0033FC8426